MAETQPQGTPLRLVRRLLALAKSSEPHEAALARQRADEIIRRHGFSELDLKEESTERPQLSPGLPGNQRVELARVVAYSRGVTSDGGLSFRGYPEAAKDACCLFLALVRIVEGNCEIAGQEADRLLWRTCCWLGFVTGVQRQLDPEHASVPREALTSIIQRATTPTDVVNAAHAYEDLRDRSNAETAERFKQDAYDSGLALAHQVQIPPYRGKQ